MVEFLELVAKNPSLIQQIGFLLLAVFALFWIGRAVYQLSTSLNNTTNTIILQLGNVRQATIQLAGEIRVLQHLIDWAKASHEIDEEVIAELKDGKSKRRKKHQEPEIDD